ncbi:MAG: hypothetical protein J7L15_00895 [Clostridiales bacterium]|nr:hypothetical protein [Clostridiales bacterium]
MIKTTKSYCFFTDPGHGWLRVLLTELEPIKDKISPYSYMRGKYAYLEEDCDMAVFLEHKFGKLEQEEWKKLWSNGTLKEKYVEKTSIRNCEHYYIRTEEEQKFMQIVIDAMLKMNLTKSSFNAVKNASYEYCKRLQDYYNIIV